LDRDGVGAGDPSAMVPWSNRRTLVSLGGLRKLAIVDENDAIERTFDVGARPVSVLPTPDGRRACVVNQLDDSVSIVDLETGATREISLGSQPEAYPRDRGERLFFDARLTPGGYLSCHSCHTDGHTNGRTADTLADATYGTPKRVLTLMGTALTDQWSWNGSLRELRDQVRQSFETTMHATPLSPEQHDDVVAFLHTLPFPPPPSPTPRDDEDRRLLEWGRAVFKSFGCASCHVAPLTYTTQGSFDVGLDDERGLAKFNPPSLRGVGHGAAFFHDNRAATLDDVFRSFGHQVPANVDDADIDALVRFLKSL
jgi:YVTN family beta-propeller protein